MQINEEMLKKILTMNDGELKKIISSAASEKGLGLSGISDADIGRIRSAMESLTKDPSVMNEIAKGLKDQKKGGNRNG